MATIGELAVKLGLDDSGFQSGVKQAESRTSRLSGTFKSATKVVAGATAAIGAAGTAMFAMANKAAQTADELDKSAMKMGVNTTALQELRFAMGQTGVSQEALDRGLGRLNQRIGRAADGNEKYGDALVKLGFNLEDVKSGALSTDEVFMKSIETLNGMENAQQQSALASELFGTKLARDLMPAFQAGTLEIEDLRNMTHELGGVMSEEAIEAGVLFVDTMDQIQTMVRGVATRIGVNLLPVVQEFLEWVQGYMPEIQNFFQTTFDVIEVVVTTAIDTFRNYLLPVLQVFMQWVTDNMPMIQETFKKVFEAIQSIIKNFVESATLLWDNFGEAFVKNTVTQFKTVWNTIESALKVINGILDVFIGLFTGDWQRMANGIKDIWSGMWEAIRIIIAGEWNVLKTAFSSLYNAIKGWFTGLVSDAIQWGKDLMTGFRDGIVDMAMAPVNAARDAAENVADSVKGFFRISSPSKLFAEYGGYLMKGMEEGVEKNKNLAIDAVKRVASQMTTIADNAVDSVRGVFDNSSGGSSISSRSSSSSSSSDDRVAKRVYNEKGTHFNDYDSSGRNIGGGKAGTENLRFHDGGPVGQVTAKMRAMLQNLKHDEVPAVLQTGEYVLSRRMIDNLSNDRGGVTQNITINSPSPLKASDIARQTKRASQELAMGM